MLLLHRLLLLSNVSIEHIGPVRFLNAASRTYDQKKKRISSDRPATATLKTCKRAAEFAATVKMVEKPLAAVAGDNHLTTI